jgi:hypothetical protein
MAKTISVEGAGKTRWAGQTKISGEQVRRNHHHDHGNWHGGGGTCNDPNCKRHKKYGNRVA